MSNARHAFRLAYRSFRLDRCDGKTQALGPVAAFFGGSSLPLIARPDLYQSPGSIGPMCRRVPNMRKLRADMVRMSRDYGPVPLPR